MKILTVIRNLLWIYIIYNFVSYIGFNLVVNDVSLSQVKTMLNTTNDYFSLIEIDEYNNCAYLYRNWNYGEIKKMSRYSLYFESSYRIYISKHNNFQEVIEELYEYNQNIPPIYYNNPSTISTVLYYISVIFTILSAIHIIFTIIGSAIIEGMKSLDMDEILGKKNNKYEIIEREKCTSRFSNVIGMESVKKDLNEYINCMKNRSEYLEAGIDIPRGLLFVGTPGTGKTHMARALAGECNATFINVSASNVSGIYIGTGPATIKSIFETARKKAPSVVFIDELDSIGGERMQSINGGAAMEHNSTINSLLTELDGFNPSDNILVIGATNMHKSLDNALTRSGRLERKIVFELPNLDERKQLISMYFENKPLKSEIKNDFSKNLDFLAKRMAGLSPADIKNIANQSALIYMINRKISNNNEKVNSLNLHDYLNKNKKLIDNIQDGIELSHIEQAIDDVIVGIEKRERTVSKDEQKMIAYHESGHTLMSLILEGMKPPIKTSIVPRGINALGYSQTEGDDKKLHTREELISEVCILLGGRCAEKLIFNTLTTGASDDLEKATRLMSLYLTKYGMNKKYGIINTDGLLSKNKKIENLELLKKMLDEIEEFVDNNLFNHQEELNKLSNKLLETEVLNKQEAIDLVTEEKINKIDVKDLIYTLDKL